MKYNLSQFFGKLLLDITPDAKNSFKLFFHCEIWILFKLAVFYKFLNYHFFCGLFTKKAGKLKVAEANQAKAGLTKLWLATGEASWSLEQFARR